MEKQTKILIGVGAFIAAYLILKPKKAYVQTNREPIPDEYKKPNSSQLGLLELKNKNVFSNDNFRDRGFRGGGGLDLYMNPVYKEPTPEEIKQLEILQKDLMAKFEKEKNSIYKRGNCFQGFKEIRNLNPELLSETNCMEDQGDDEKNMEYEKKINAQIVERIEEAKREKINLELGIPFTIIN